MDRDISRLIMTIAAITLVAVASRAHAAQEPGFSQRYRQSGASPGGGVGWGPERMLSDLRSRLQLTPKQFQVIEPIARHGWERRRAIREHFTLSPLQKYEQSKEIRARTRARINPHLTSRQRQILAEMDHEFNERMRLRYLGDTFPPSARPSTLGLPAARRDRGNPMEAGQVAPPAHQQNSTAKPAPVKPADINENRGRQATRNVRAVQTGAQPLSLHPASNQKKKAPPVKAAPVSSPRVN